MRYKKILSAGVVLCGLAMLNLSAGPPVPVVPECDDFMTGGGWIPAPNPTPACNGKASFGFVGGIKNGELWGNLNHKDHCNGYHAKGTDLIDYCFTDRGETCRRLVWNGHLTGGLFNKTPVTIVVDACDHGEPGINDIYEIIVYLGTTPGPTSCEGPFGTGVELYRAGQGHTLGGGEPGGGNIQLHTRCD